MPEAPNKKKEAKKKLMELFDEIVEHGFGKFEVHVTEARDFKTKILIWAGKSYIFFIDKPLPEFKGKQIL